MAVYTGNEKASLNNIKEMIDNGASLQQIRGAMGLGRTLGVLEAANGGTGVNNLQDVADVIVSALTGGGEGSYNIAKDINNIANAMFVQSKSLITTNDLIFSEVYNIPKNPGYVELPLGVPTSGCTGVIFDGTSMYVPVEGVYSFSITYYREGEDRSGSNVDETIYLEYLKDGETWTQIASNFLDSTLGLLKLSGTVSAVKLGPTIPLKFRLRRDKKTNWNGILEGAFRKESSKFKLY